MTDSKRWQVLEALRVGLAGITMANGYSLDIANSYKNRLFFGDEEATPFINVLESPEQPEAVEKGGTDIEFQDCVFIVQGWVDDDVADPGKPADELRGQIKKALRQMQQTRLNGLVIRLSWTGGYVRPDDKTNESAYCLLEVVARVAEQLDDPYAT